MSRPVSIANIDGMEHAVGDDCDGECPKCGATLHYQAAYGGPIEVCEGCDDDAHWWEPRIYRGEPDCGDCLSMTHCETHHKVVGTYPPDASNAARPRDQSGTVWHGGGKSLRGDR